MRDADIVLEKWLKARRRWDAFLIASTMELKAIREKNEKEYAMLCLASEICEDRLKKLRESGNGI